MNSLLSTSVVAALRQQGLDAVHREGAPAPGALEPIPLNTSAGEIAVAQAANPNAVEMSTMALVLGVTDEAGTGQPTSPPAALRMRDISLSVGEPDTWDSNTNFHFTNPVHAAWTLRYCLECEFWYGHMTISVSGLDEHIIGLLKQEDGWVLYADHELEAVHICSEWGMDRRARNRLMHALNGNGKRGGPRDGAPARDPAGAPAKGGKERKCSSCGHKFSAVVPKQNKCEQCLFDAEIQPADDDASMMGLGAGADTAQKGGNKSKAHIESDASKGLGTPVAGRMMGNGFLKLWATILCMQEEYADSLATDFNLVSWFGHRRVDVADETMVLGCGSAEKVDFIVTFDHNAYHERYEDYEYTRTGDFDVAIVNGHRAPIHDWLYTPTRMGKINGQGHIATKLASKYAEEKGRLISVDLFAVKRTELDVSQDAGRAAKFLARDACGVPHTYRSYCGANECAIMIDDEPVIVVDTGLFRELSRYYVNPERSNVPEGSIRGPLRNNSSLDGRQIDGLTRYFCAKHQLGIRTYNAAIGGRQHVWRESADAHKATYREKPLFCPSLVWAMINPYSDTICRMSEAFLNIAFVLVLMWIANFVVNGPVQGYVTATAAWAWGGVSTAKAQVMREPVVRGGWADHLACGQILDYIRHLYLDDKAASWRLDGSKCYTWQYALINRIINISPAFFFAVFVSPIVEELYLKRANLGIDFGWRISPEYAVRISLMEPANFFEHCWCRLVKWYISFRDRHSDVGCFFLVFIIVCETFYYQSFMYVPTALMHLWCHEQVWWKAILGHFCWNLMCGLVNPGHLPPVIPGSLGAAAVGLAGLSRLMFTQDEYVYAEPAGLDSEFTKLIKDPEFESHFPLKDDAEIKFKEKPGTRTKNRLVHLLQPFVQVASFASNQANMLHSLAGRVLKKTPPCVRSTAGLQSIVNRMAGKMGQVDPVPGEQWASKFPPAKRNRYLQALVRLSIFGLAFFGTHLCGAKHDWAIRNCFLKHEVNLLQEDKIVRTSTRTYRIACSDPRTIQASADELQALVGPFFVAAGERASLVFDGSADSKIDGWRICAAFGRTKVEVSRIKRMIIESGDNGIVDCGDDGYLIWGGKEYAIDASRWDAHVRKELLKLKTQHLRGIGMHADFTRILERLTDRQGKYTGSSLSFSVSGDVASGDPDTLYWNTICGIAVILDCVKRADGDFDKFCENSLEYGIKYELAASGPRGAYSPGLDFCSCVFTPSAEGPVMAPKLGRSMMKMASSANNTMPPAKLLSAKIRGLQSDLAVFPEVVQILGKKLATLPDAPALSESYFPVGKVAPASYEERERFFIERYGISYASVLEDMRVWISRPAGHGESGDLRALQRLVEVDYGKAPLLPSAQQRGGSSRVVGSVVLAVLAMFALCCLFVWIQSVWMAGGAVKTVPDLNSTFTAATSSTIIMPGNKKASNNNNNKRANAKKAAPTKQAAKLSADAISGKGFYKLLLPAAKLALRSALPAALGSAASMIRPNASNIRGSGEYLMNDIIHDKSQSKSLMPKSMGHGVPQTRFTHSEYITDIVVPSTPTTFVLSKYTLNPADAATFPWLSRLASLYTKYKFSKLVVEFRTSTSNYSAAGSLGTIVMAPQYNVDAYSFTNKQIMEAATHAVSGAPSSSILMGFECAPEDNSNKWYYILNDSTSVRSNLTDMGSFSVATTGLPGTAGTVLGELWVHYTCDLIEPYISVTDAVSTGALAWQTGFSSAGNAATMSTGFMGSQHSALVPLSSSYFSTLPGLYVGGSKTSGTSLPSGSNWYVSCSGDAGNTLGFRLAGVYAIDVRVRLSGSTTLANGAPWDLSANSGTLVSVIGNNSGALEFPWTTAGTSWLAYRYIVQVGANTGLTSTLTGGWTGTGALTVPACFIIVTKLA